ncbi:ATPase family like-protein [Emericellopsis cladophorae]|uniref:ATPase family like-protein n=1 Tax=Emericellopsis cladophorae TaxID=2686198 RepID=A0A9P9Y856_9HYPO|nr:ATPase family like-protein [Emericellopsis cladophorae]KAI6785206.1 ATPase family like-protein [Emericellopsis cladophorae]
MPPTKTVEAKVRPLANQSLEKASLQGAARLYVNRDALIALTGSLDNGKPCFVARADGDVPLKREGSLWVLTDKNISPNVVMMSRAFQEATGFKIGDAVQITTPEGKTEVEDAEEIVVQDTTEDDEDGSDWKYPPSWESTIAGLLNKAGEVFPGMTLEANASKLRRTFKVLSANSRRASIARFRTGSTAIRIVKQDVAEADHAVQPRGDLSIAPVPGMATQTKHINNFLSNFSRQLTFPNARRSCGYVVHGGHGTGRTFILERIAETNWGKVHWIKPSDKLAAIREIFKQAQTQQPSMVLIDDFEKLIPSDRQNRDAIIETLADELDGLSARTKTLKALPQLVIVVTCTDYYTDIPVELQNITRLRANVALPIPRAPERLEILKYHDPPMYPAEKDACLEEIANKTHAYNCKDLSYIVSDAMALRETALAQEGGPNGQPEPDGPNDQTNHYVTREDMLAAQRGIRPAAMRDINLQPPIVHWTDVGGQEEVKKRLSHMIRLTKNTDPKVRAFLPKPPKGLLLYGPPGCSKTLSAQAMATEASFNFFAVKAAELLNMYVGESERAVRDLFQRARAASPSIIFFDEIDSMGGTRAGPGAAKTAGGVNMLTSLLTEMDGFESLEGVLILAATNRPDAMDPALLRPGRFDHIVYVGPPEQAAREAVFNVHLRGKTLAPNVDIAELARLAEGYSGAEIASICSKTAEEVHRRYLDGEGELEISMDGLLAAMAQQSKGITKDMIDGYERWAQRFKSK